jgi:hypothetical protein
MTCMVLFFILLITIIFDKLAASVMYYRAMRIGDKGEGLEALEAQKESYLDVVTCLSHLEEDSFRYVIQHTGASPEFSEPSVSLNGDKVIKH